MLTHASSIHLVSEKHQRNWLGNSTKLQVTRLQLLTRCRHNPPFFSSTQNLARPAQWYNSPYFIKMEKTFRFPPRDNPYKAPCQLQYSSLLSPWSGYNTAYVSVRKLTAGRTATDTTVQLQFSVREVVLALWTWTERSACQRTKLTLQEVHIIRKTCTIWTLANIKNHFTSSLFDLWRTNPFFHCPSAPSFGLRMLNSTFARSLLWIAFHSSRVISLGPSSLTSSTSFSL